LNVSAINKYFIIHDQII